MVKHKKWENFKRAVSRFHIELGLAVNFGLILAAVCLFFIGFHNLDLSFNMLKLSYDAELDYYSLVDTAMSGKDFSYNHGYIIATRQMMLSFFLGIIGALGYGGFTNKLKEKLKKCHKKE